MRKIIKKTVNILLVPGAILVVLPFILFILLRIPFVQTYVVQGVTKYISSEFKSTVSVGKVQFSYFNRLVLSDVLIKDKNNDTLVFAKKITAGIRQFDIKRSIMRFGRVNINNPVIALITDSTGSSNLNWYLDKISGNSTDTTINTKALFHISRINIINGRFALIDRKAGPSSSPIDFGKLRVDSISGVIDDFTVRNDSTTLGINGFSFRERNGFRIKKMSSKLLLNKSDIILTKTSIICDSSIINADRIALLADSSGSFSRFLQEVKLDVQLNKSLIYISEVNYFAPLIKDLNESIWLSGHVSGTVSELKGRNIHIAYKNETTLDCSFDLSGLPDIKNTFIFLEINDFRSVSRDIEQINLPGKGRILVPEPLRKLGVVSFSGTFTGFTTDFVAYGKINTNKGLISTDISLRPEKDKRFRIKGLMKGTEIALGQITGNTDLLGNLTIETNVDGYTDSFKTFAVNLTGKIDSVDINNYIYRDVVLKGYFTDKAWDGNIKVNDRNINMELLGMFDFNKALPEFDFTMNLQKARLYNLHIVKADTSASVSLLLTANFKGNNIDNLDGEIRLLNSSFRKFGTNLEVYDFSLKTFLENSKPAISLRTDFFDANLKGRYNFSALGNAVKNALSVLIPSSYGIEKLPVIKGENDFTFNIKLKKTDELNKFLHTGMVIAENTSVSGRVLTDSVVSINAQSASFEINSNVFTDLQIDAKFADTTFKAEINTKNLNLAGISDLKDLHLGLDAFPYNYRFLMFWDNKDKDINKGRVEAVGTFASVSPENHRSKMKLELYPGEIDVKDEIWKINPSEILVDSSSVKISRFNVNSGENYFLIDGAVSENPQDTLYMKFNGINLKPLNNLYEKGQAGNPNMLHLSIGGALNGKISLTDVYKSFMFESDIRLKNFTLLNSNYGNIRIGSVWNNEKKIAEINASNNLDGVRMFNIEGFYDPNAANMDLTATETKMPLDALNPLLNFFASGIGGKVTGKVRISGDPSKLNLTGSLWAEDCAMKIDYIQSKFRFTDSIRFDKTGIKFNNISLKDEKGNTAILNGTVFHNHFNDFAVDLTLKTKDLMVLNTKPKDNDVFYGTAYATGLISIKTVGPVLKFDISAKTGKNTRFFIPLNSSLSVAQNNFVSFVQPAGTQKETKTIVVVPPSNSGGLDIGFDLEITPDAEVQLIMDPKTGDIMKGTGRGNLNINLDPKGSFKMYGDYTLESGDYLFTLGNIINKSFNVESGGKISFNGDVEDADIDMKAIYKTKASLYDIMPGILPESKQNERIPVECQLLLSGKLFNPTVGFDIYLPTADEQTRAYLRSMIKSDEEMSRQFLFLLVMNSFYSDQGATSQIPAGMGTATVGVTTMEMLSSQLSNWLSQISNDFDIGVVYRPGTTQLPNSQELQVALSTQLLNDKVVINGNFDVAGSQATTTTGAVSGTNSFTGVFDIEYKINEKVRFKFFNRSNDNFYIDNGIPYTQGIGLFFRQDFNKFSDLFKKTPKGDLKKQKKAKPVNTK